MTVKPISPSETTAGKIKSFPPVVFEVFNEMLSAGFTGGNIVTIMQEDVVNEIVKRTEANRAEVFQKGWLNIEPVYREQGWHVVYDKPGFNESYGAYWKFKAKRC